MVNTRLNMPLPWPRLVFQSLANKWNAFAPMQLWINWADFDRQVTVARFDLKTKLLDFGGFRQVGFVGECWFLIDPEARVPLRHALYTLAQFAFYAGVGRKTTMGMGMVRPLGSRDA
jgi:CRISPR-associated endoribonuclease Cas6